MKYFLDTEFLEGPQKEKFPISLFRKNTPNTIDLISIGIVAEDGRELYLISKDFNLKEAWNRFDEKVEIMSGDMRNHFPNGKKYKEYWIRDNVLKPIWRELFFQSDDCAMLSNKQAAAFQRGIAEGKYDDLFTYKSLKALIAKYGKTKKEIVNEISSFCLMGSAYSSMDKSIASVMYFSELGEYERSLIARRKLQFVFNEVPEFYAYYADYDWVVFCWLFGKMINLPKGFPKYCIDLKQILDEKAKIQKEAYNPEIKKHFNFPKQDPSKSHNAIEDARWNKQLFDFFNTI